MSAKNFTRVSCSRGFSCVTSCDTISKGYCADMGGYLLHWAAKVSSEVSTPMTSQGRTPRDGQAGTRKDLRDTQKGRKGGRRKGGRGRKLSHFSFCGAFRCCVVYSPCFPVSGVKKKSYDNL